MPGGTLPAVPFHKIVVKPRYSKCIVLNLVCKPCKRNLKVVNSIIKMGVNLLTNSEQGY